MTGLLMLHRLAGGRGDGLLPTFTTLFEEREAARSVAANLRELPVCSRQSGPNPQSRSPDRLPDNVVAFAPRTR